MNNSFDLENEQKARSILKKYQNSEYESCKFFSIFYAILPIIVGITIAFIIHNIHNRNLANMQTQVTWFNAFGITFSYIVFTPFTMIKNTIGKIFKIFNGAFSFCLMIEFFVIFNNLAKHDFATQNMQSITLSFILLSFLHLVFVSFYISFLVKDCLF